MIPSTLAGLLVFIASVTPGYVWVRATERRVLREQRSALLEAAELILIGSLASACSAIAIVSAAEAIGVLDTGALRSDPQLYVLRHPARGLGAGVLTLLCSVALVWVAARIVHGGKPAMLVPGSAWDNRFHVPVREGSDETLSVWATIELTDGRRISGWVGYHTAGEPDGRREVVLVGPLAAWSPEMGSVPAEPIADELAIVSEERIALLTARYYER